MPAVENAGGSVPQADGAGAGPRLPEIEPAALHTLQAALDALAPESQKAIAMGAGDAGNVAPVPATTLQPEDWKTVIAITGLCHGYDIEKSPPIQAIEPLFKASGNGTPVFVPDDKATVLVDATHTQRHRHFVESGFHAVDLDIVVPYVTTSLKAANEERQISEQEKKTVFFTVKAEFPRARVDILQSIKCGYLEINPVFVAYLSTVWTEVSAKLKVMFSLREGDLDAKAAAQRLLDEFEQHCMDATTFKEVSELAKVVSPIRSIMIRFGAVWVEQLTVGGQIYNTSKEELQWDSDIMERKEMLQADVKGHANGISAGIGATMQSLTQSESSNAKGSVNLSQQAVGGDSLIYDAQNATKWLDSVKPFQNWRIIGQRHIRQLSILPGLEKYHAEDGNPSSLKLDAALQTMLIMLEKLVEREGELKDSPRKPLLETWSTDVVGSWFGCQTYYDQNGHPPTVLRLNLLGPPSIQHGQNAKPFKKTTTFYGHGHDASGPFQFQLVMSEVDVKDFSVKEASYEFLAHIDMNKLHPGLGGPSTVQPVFRGHLDRAGMHGFWYNDLANPPKIGTWTALPTHRDPPEGVLFNETEESIGEPRRRWLLPPQVKLGTQDVFHASQSRAREMDPFDLLSAERFAGKWTGLALDLDKTTLPPPTVVKFKVPELVGGSNGIRRYKLVGSGHCGELLLSLRGIVLAQVTRSNGATPNPDPTYPILATVEFTVEQKWKRFPCIPLPFFRDWHWRGHLDHLGVHGYFGNEKSTLGTFSMMPLQPDYEGKRWEEAQQELARIRLLKKRVAHFAQSKRAWCKCWPVSKKAIDSDDP